LGFLCFKEEESSKELEDRMNNPKTRQKPSNSVKRGEWK
jgi:hypothetical protein